MVITGSETEAELVIKAEVRPISVVKNYIEMATPVRVHISVTIATLYCDLLVIFRAIDLEAVPQPYRGLRERQAF